MRWMGSDDETPHNLKNKLNANIHCKVDLLSVSSSITRGRDRLTDGPTNDGHISIDFNRSQLTVIDLY